MATLKDLLVSGPARVIGNITGKSFIKEGGTSSQFLKADGSVDSNTYSTTSHNHSGVYKPVQTEVLDPTASTSTSTTFIDKIAQDKNGVITATKKTLPTASSTVAGITTVGAAGGAAAYKHSHDTSITTSNGTNQITLAFGTKYAISAGGTSYVFTMPVNPNTNTTYTIATGDAKGQIKVTPSSGDAYNVSVKGLGSAAYTESSDYATSGHNHSGVYKPIQTAVSSPSASSTSSAFIDTISQDKNGVITATKKNLPTASTTIVGVTTVGAAGGAAAYSHNHSDVYKPVQTAVSDPTASTSTSTTFIDTISQDKNGVITATKKTLPTASSTVAGITTIGAFGGAAAYKHTHDTSITTSSGTNQITLAFGTKYSISNGGTSYVFTMPSLPTATSSVAGIATLGASDGSATYDHTHGSITNAGAITSNTTIANGDHLVITDNSDSNKIKRASITFGTSQSTYLRNDGKWGTPSTSTPLATPLFDGDAPGIVTPIASTENEVAYKGAPTSYNTIPTLIFPSASSTMALPIFMDKSGRLFMLIPDKFATDLINTYGYSTTPSGGKS